MLALLMGTGPLMALVGSHLFTVDDKINALKLIAVALGFSGVIVLVGGATIGGLGGAHIVAQLATLAASLCYSTSGLLVRRIDIPPTRMNAEALALTLETGIAHYWSRSRGQLWKKGETSGNLQRVAEMRTDCDQDVVLVAVRTDGHGSACHTGRKSCFYRHIVSDGENGARLTFDEGDRPRFDPATVYGNG